MVGHFKPRSATKQKGKTAEDATKKALAAWVARDPMHREFNRLLDSKAAMRIVKAAPADFDYYAVFDRGTAVEQTAFGLIECKETKHEYRLSRSKVTQLPHLVRRARCGGTCGVLVYHSTLNKYRMLLVEWMEATEGASWDLRDVTLHDSAEQALAHLHCGFST